jgi:hypothetical protein
MIDIIEDVEDIQNERKEYLEHVKKLDNRLDDLGVEWVDLVKEVSTAMGSFQFPGLGAIASPNTLALTESDAPKRSPERTQTKRPHKKRSKRRGSTDVKYEESVLIYISSVKDPVSAKQIRNVVGGTRFKSQTAISHLLEQRKIFKTGRTRGTKYHLNL